jgi:UDP-N-acetylglucosamine 2-epimerase (non-hydrolysing)
MDVKMKTVVFIYGTRPELIKLAPVMKCFRRDKVFLLSTGQQGSILNDTHRLFRLRPDMDLEMLRYSSSANLTGNMKFAMSGVHTTLSMINNPEVVVQGDTTSALAGAMTAFNTGIKVYHVEAGLRSNNREDPYPEEMYRVLIDNISDVCFTPTTTASAHILNLNCKVVLTGNTIVDAVRMIKLKPKAKQKPYILVTCHRRENLHDKKEHLHVALSKLSSEIKIKYIKHPNYSMPVAELRRLFGVDILEPQSYDKFLYLIKNCRFIVTDSGGLQEEAAIFMKPCLVIRDSTERMESIKLGVARLIGWQAEDIYRECFRLLDDFSLSTMVNNDSPFLYGQPGAGRRIYDELR